MFNSVLCKRRQKTRPIKRLSLGFTLKGVFKFEMMVCCGTIAQA